jgi:outer membrane protein assembly factor BamA
MDLAPLAFAALSAALVSCAARAAPPPAHEAEVGSPSRTTRWPEYAWVRFEGNAHVTDDALLAAIAEGVGPEISATVTVDVETPDGPATMKSQSSQSTRGRIAHDIETAYWDLGYLDVRLAGVREERGPNGNASSVFRIDEGPRYKLRELQIADDATRPDAVGDRAALRAMLHGRIGEWFSGPPLHADVRALMTRYHDASYALVVVDPQMKKDPLAGDVRITVKIERGFECAFDGVLVRGNAKIEAGAIREAFGVPPESPYSDKALAQGGARVRALPGIAKATIGTNLVHGAPHRIVVEITVTER